MPQPAVVGPPNFDKFLDNKFVPFNWESSHFIPSTTLSFSATEKFLIKSGKLKLRDKDISYDLNSFALRCNDFTKDKETNKFLFAGCSFTFGEALPHKTNWSGQLFESLNNDSGAFQEYNLLGYCGASIDYILDNIYAYLKKFNQPENIFILFPDSKRKTANHRGARLVLIPQDMNDRHYEYTWGGVDSFDYQLLKIKKLEDYCNNNKIKLFWSTWDQKERDKFLQCELNNFIYFNNEDINKQIKDKKIFLNEHKKYYEIARDNIHPGIGYNSAIANIFMERYVSKNNK